MIRPHTPALARWLHHVRVRIDREPPETEPLMHSTRVVFAFTLSLTAITMRAHANGTMTDERRINATNHAMTAERPAEHPSPQTPDDGELEYRIMVRLASIDPYKLGDVHARSVRGAVTLYGTVPDADSRDRALVLANGFDGVNVVRDEIELRPVAARGGGPADDATITVRAQNAVTGFSGAVGGPLRVAVRNGVVTVIGTVATYADAMRVTNALKNVPDVIAVRSAMRVNAARVVMIDGDRNARRR